MLETIRKESKTTIFLPSGKWQQCPLPVERKPEPGCGGRPSALAQWLLRTGRAREGMVQNTHSSPGLLRCLPRSPRTSMRRSRIARRKTARACREEQTYWWNKTHCSKRPAASVKRKEALRRSKENLWPRSLPSVPFKQRAKLLPPSLHDLPAIFQLHSRLMIRAKTNPTSCLVLLCCVIMLRLGRSSKLWLPSGLLGCSSHALTWPTDTL